MINLREEILQKKSLIPFTSVAIVQSLEQSINCSQKSTSGIIGYLQ